MAEQDPKFRLQVEKLDDSSLDKVKQVFDEVIAKQKELPKNLIEWNKVSKAQNAVLKETERSMDAIRDKMREIHLVSKDADRSSASALQKEEKHLEKLLQLRQKEFVQAREHANVYKRYSSDEQFANKTANTLKQMTGGGAFGKSLPGSLISGGLDLIKANPLMAGIATAIGTAYAGVKLIDKTWENGKQGRDFNIGSQSLSYRYKLSQDLAEYTSTNQPGKAGLMSNMTMMNEFYPALGKSTGSTYLEKADRMIPYLAQYKHNQGISAEETGEVLNMGIEGGFVNPRGTAHNVTSETGEALSTITSAVAAGAGMGFDRSTRMEQLHKLISMGNKDLGTIYKDTGKNIVGQLRTLENLNIRGLTGDKAADVITNSKDMVKSIPTGLFKAMEMTGQMPDQREATIERFQKEYGQTKEQATKMYESSGPVGQAAADKTTLTTGPNHLEKMKQFLDKTDPMIAAQTLGLGEDSDKWEKFNTMRAALDNPNFSKAQKEAAYEAAIPPNDKDVKKNKYADQAENVDMLKGNKDLNTSIIEFRAVMKGEEEILKKEIIAQDHMTTAMDKFGSTIEHIARNGLDAPIRKKMADNAKESLKGGGDPVWKLIKDSGKEAKGDVVNFGQYLNKTGKEAKNESINMGGTLGKWGKGIGKWSGLIASEASAAGIPANLVAGVMQQESGGKRTAISSAGAEGLMQLMPKTARGLGVTNSFDPKQNIRGGTKYLRDLLVHYHGDTQKAVAAYNMGEGGLDKFLKKYGSLESAEKGFITRKNGSKFYFPNETKDYIKKVMNNVESYEQAKQLHTEKMITHNTEEVKNRDPYSTKSGLSYSGKYGSNNIDNVNIYVPGFTITQKGKDQLKQTFSHELVPAANSTGRN